MSINTPAPNIDTSGIAGVTTEAQAAQLAASINAKLAADGRPERVTAESILAAGIPTAAEATKAVEAMLPEIYAGVSTINPDVGQIGPSIKTGSGSDMVITNQGLKDTG